MEARLKSAVNVADADAIDDKSCERILVDLLKEKRFLK